MTKKSRRDIFCFGSIVENQIFNNCAIIDVGNESKEEEIDDLFLDFLVIVIVIVTLMKRGKF
jgi:hypothetical protein